MKKMHVLPALALVLTLSVGAFAQSVRTGQFSGPKANTGFVTMTKEKGSVILTLSDDFVVPDTPDPHWRVVDSNGTIYDLQKLKIKDDGFNKSIRVPSYVRNVAKVVIWCAWAEANLGEASFTTPVSD